MTRTALTECLLKLITLAICIPLAAGSSVAATYQKIRPVTLKVVDATSRRPLQGIVVHYVVFRATYRTSTLGVLPPIEPLVERTPVGQLSGKTDANGEVNFGGIEVSLETYRFRPRMDKVDSEVFFVNLEPGPELLKRGSTEGGEKQVHELLFRTLPKLVGVVQPNARYKGYVLQTVAEISHAHSREQEVASVEFVPTDFARQDAGKFLLPLHENTSAPTKP
jgi:hypothetical protein